MRLVFFGSGEFALASLRALLDGSLAPELVVTQPPRRRRRGARPEPTPVHAAAEAANLAVITPENVNRPAPLARLRGAGADLFAVAEYGQILSQELLDIPPSGAVNVHGSLLPRWRGATPVMAAVRAGDAETGVTIQRVVRELDAGPVLARRRVPIGPDDDTGALRATLARLGAGLLVEVVSAFASGTPPPAQEQDASQATFCRRLKPDDTRIDWSQPAAEIERLVRALRPKPGARAVLLRDPELPLQVRRAAVVDGAASPGVVVAVSRDGFEIGTGRGRLRVLEVCPAARKAMDARAFVNGYRVQEGERFR